ncbi:DUF3188 domain-containing protein [Arthrobacter sp. ZGTC412]|uniref:DUF3188 domain-containing protein n=1 Tax=Arthrobacter sp. ZGTC412 TaxID=2058900 RepID=UPI001CA5A700|nr:hypothetical protein [Arthrobacter sp. ZGTC412]
MPLLIVAIGVAVFVLGGADDSPGLQGIGAVLVAGAIILCVGAVRRDRRRRW